MEAAEATSDEQTLSGQIVVFRVRVSGLSRKRIVSGREDEDEYLIQGRIEEVSISSSEVEDEEEEDHAD